MNGKRHTRKRLGQQTESRGSNKPDGLSKQLVEGE